MNVLRSTGIDPRMRRFARTLDDLGLPLPDNWATVEVDADGTPVKVDFASVPWATLDRLVCLLEDIAEARPVTVIRPMGGPTLFDIDPSPAPTPAPRSTTLHISVPV